MNRRHPLTPRVIALLSLAAVALPGQALDLLEHDRYWERNPEAWADNHAYEAREHRYFADEHRWIRKEDRDAWRTEYESLLATVREQYAGQLAQLDGGEDVLFAALESGDAGGIEHQRALTLYPRYSPDNLSGLTAADERMLDELVGALGGKREIRVEVTGHANALPLSPRAAERFGDNQALSAARAQAVADYLAQRLELDANAITSRGVGASQPMIEGNTPSAHARNRRVEVALTFRDAPIVAAPLDAALPADFEPWWAVPVAQPMTDSPAVREEDIASLYLRAIQHSSQIEVFRDVPLIRETAILEAEGDFDPRLFMEAEFRDTDEPVGSTLRTGGPDRFKEQQLAYTAGMRKKVLTGGEVELSQRLGTQQNNSVFFLPDDQAQTRMQLSFTQPLLRGAGLGYNRSTVAIAKIDHSIAEDELQRQVESHLLEIAQAYWNLYQERAGYLISQRLAARSNALVEQLQGRRAIDALESQIATARAAAAERGADLVRRGKGIRNAEARLVTLVNDPELNFALDFELVPTLPPLPPRVTPAMDEAARHALTNRPEIDQAMKQLRAGMVRARVSENEMLPELDFIAGMELNGLDGRDDIGGSFDNQFGDGDPSYFVGLRLNYAIGNRAAKARYQRRRIEVRQLTNQLRTTINTLMLETQISVREAHASRQELKARYAALKAAEHEVETLQARQDVSMTQGEQGSDYLARLLNAQENLADAEQALVASQVTYSLAMVNLDRAMGTLMQTQGIDATRDQPEALPPSIELSNTR